MRNVARNEIIGTLTIPYDATTTGAIEAGGVRQRQVTFTLPQGNKGAGELQFQITTDVTNTIAEGGVSGSGESNNTTRATVVSSLTAYPDLQASGLSVTPAGAWVPNSQVSMQWRVTNTGNAAVV